MCALGISGGVGRAMQQTTFASMACQNKGKITRRERFLAEMDAWPASTISFSDVIDGRTVTSPS